MTVCSSPFIAGLYNAIMSLHITRICVTYMIAICVHRLIDDCFDILSSIQCVLQQCLYQAIVYTYTFIIYYHVTIMTAIILPDTVSGLKIPVHCCVFMVFVIARKRIVSMCIFSRFNATTEHSKGNILALSQKLK